MRKSKYISYRLRGRGENKTGHDRGVALVDAGYKNLAAILEERLRNWLEKEGKYKESQAGFRRKRATRDHVRILNSLINSKLKVNEGKLYANTIDFKKAFNTVDRGLLVDKLKQIGIEGRMLNMVRKIYSSITNRLITSVGITQPFSTNRGVRQGCPHCPTLYIHSKYG